MTFEEARALHKDPEEAFELAIQTGRLSENEDDANYAGYYMYMGISADGTVDAFKHILTREYI